MAQTLTQPDAPPARVRELRGIIFQSDGHSTIGAWFIRPVESLDRWVAGMYENGYWTSLAMHAGIHLVLEDGREVVAEQLVGTWHNDFVSGLNWTDVADFRKRDHENGWDVTIPATAFRGIDERAVDQTVQRLNTIQGHPFVGEDCTAFVERAFGGRRMFADSPLLQTLGFGARIGDPALPLLRPDARLDPRAERLLRGASLRRLPDALSSSEAPNARFQARRLAVAALVGGGAGLALAQLAGKRLP